MEGNMANLTESGSQAVPLPGVGSIVSRFFYTREVPYAIALVRMIICSVCMIIMGPRWLACRELFSVDGATTPVAIGYSMPNWLPEFNGTIVAGLATLMMICLFTSAVGWRTRTSLTIAAILFTYFSCLDSVSTMTKYMVISTHVLFLLSFSSCGKIWSVDAWLRRQHSTDSQPEMGESWCRRCLQLLMCSFYFGAAFTKMHTPTFFSGEQLTYWMMTELTIDHPLGYVIAMYPPLIVAMGYITIVWEIAFPLLVWRDPGRTVMLIIGVMFHVMTYFTLGLDMFPPVCFALYLTFYGDRDYQAVGRWFARRLQPALRFVSQFRMPNLSIRYPQSLVSRSSFGLFAVFLLTGTAAGIGLEHSLDRYGQRRAEGRYALTPLDHDVADRMLAPLAPTRESDKLFAFDIGTFLIGDYVGDRCREFWPGQTIVAQCSFVPPHEDMMVECNLRDADDRLVERFSHVAPREVFNCNYRFPITVTSEPGPHSLVIKIAGQEVARKSIRIHNPALAAR